ncbi:MAG: hypothetical protein CBC83_02340 [Flavobacteriales bacterium TMED123]|nr:hypothetical protein [Candidatus Neomarinimicrobiota bacterium]MAJ44521.1 hypothetical protein [Candidatus Neomarinimicrobiota bacterium]OUV73957.1 MAG: hypothetical protein CBC83_04785 [Flavobacteriales bacterium TMED123]OUV75598.1 MAG: hypothetical protein CBC83_02340 [Flavobacteriales bacterium TMED123]|tara:strand:+ start:522 stop:2522 length:2001 start_codon:yes stop_codon:yes gene_type:complete
MASTRETFPIEFKGGLITNMSPLQQGINAPGSATVLQNYECAIDGGYRRILGFKKFSSNIIPPYGKPVVHGASQTGTSIIIANIYTSPIIGDKFTVTGITGTYTISNVSFDSVNNRATLTLTTSLASSPVNAAAINFTSIVSKYTANGLGIFSTDAGVKAIIGYNNDLFQTGGDLVSSEYEKINVPNYGTPLVNGSSQTGTTLIIDGITSAPQNGDVFTINGVDKVYTVRTNATVSSGGTTLTIDPALASSPVDDAALTFISTSRKLALQTRITDYNYSGTQKIAIVDGFNSPALYDGTTYTALNSAPSDVQGASFVINYRNHLFFAKGSKLTFTAPFTDNDFNTGNNAGTIRVSNNITGLIVFREQLIIFTQNSIERITGSTASDFSLKPITTDIGTSSPESIQEVGGDIMFLGPDGLRLLSGTDRIGDFGLGVISKAIQSKLTDFIDSNINFTSVVIRSKSQYRLFANNLFSNGIIGTQFSSQGGENFAWSEMSGIKANVAASNLYNNKEVILFSNDTGYVYQLESGNSFDGANISAVYQSPFMPLNDPRMRKTIYKCTIFTNPKGSIEFDVSLKFDFDELNSVQPNAISFSNIASTVSFYGQALFTNTASDTSAKYGGKLARIFKTQTVGTGFVVSLKFETDNTNPSFGLDTATLEYNTNARR